MMLLPAAVELREILYSLQFLTQCARSQLALKRGRMPDRVLLGL